MSDGNTSSDRAVEAGRGALFIGFAKVFFMVSGFLQRVLLARFVSPAEYGAFSVVNGAVSIVNNTIVQGTIQSVSKFTAEADAHVDAVKRAGLVMQSFLGTLAAAGFFLCAPFIADLANAPDYVPWFRLVALIPLAYAFYTVFVGSANGQRRYRLQASFDVGFSTAKTVLLLGGAIIGRQTGHAVTGAFLGFIAAAVLILVVSASAVGLPRGTDRFPASRLMAYMIGAVSYTLLINLSLNYDLFLLRRFAGAATDYLHADALVANYEALRNVCLLPYQALLVVTFVIFPLVSRSTFNEDREATRLYIGQTLRYAAIIGAALAVVLAARPSALIGALYKPSYTEGVRAVPVLLAAIWGLSQLSVMGSIINASGRPRVAVAVVAATLAAGGAAAFVLVPSAKPGPAMLLASATANAIGVAVGLTLALIYLRRRFDAGPPVATIIRVLIAVALAVLAGQAFPASTKLMGLVALGVVGLAFVAALVITRELGPADAAKLRRILGRK